MMKRFRMLVLVLSLPLAFSCSLQEFLDEVNVRKPTAEVDRVRLSHLSFNSAELMFHFRVNNPNPIGVRLSRFGYDFRINGNRFLSGDQASGLNLSAGGGSEIELPLSLPFEEIAAAYRGVQGKDSAAYALSVSFSFEVPVLGVVQVPLRKEGFFPVVYVPKISIGKLRLDRMDIAGADLVLSLDIENPNRFSMLMKHMEAALGVGGREWARISRERDVRIQEDGSARMDIPVNLNFLQMGQSVYSVLAGNASLNYDLDAKIDFSTSHPLIGEESLHLVDRGVLHIVR